LELTTLVVIGIDLKTDIRIKLSICVSGNPWLSRTVVPMNNNVC
jgi:hypothetical protein